MVDHDRLFKELLSTFFLEFLDLFLPEVRAYLDEASLVFLDKEIFTDVTSGERHEADLAARVKFRDREAFFIVHVENQAHPQSEFGARMFGYFARLHQKFKLPVYPIVVFSYDKPRRPQPDTYRVEFPDLTVLEFRYRVVQLNRLDWREYVRHANPVASALMAKMRIAPKERPRVKAECLRLLATLKLDRAKMQLIAGFVDTYLQLSAGEEAVFRQELAKFEPGQQEAIMEITTSWERRGIEQGLQQGLLQGQLKLILRLLARRIGPVNDEMRERIESLPLARLEELGEALLDFSGPADLTAWLDRAPA